MSLSLDINMVVCDGSGNFMTRFHMLGAARGRRRRHLRAPEIVGRFGYLVLQRHCFHRGSGNCENLNIMISVNVGQVQ